MAPVNGVPCGFCPAVGGMPTTAQWMKSALSSTINRAISTVPAGGAAQLISGDTSAPSHVNAASMAAPSAHGTIIVNGAVAIPELPVSSGKLVTAPASRPVPGTVVDVVVVGIATRSELVGGRSVLPSSVSHATAMTTSTVATVAVTID